MFDFTLIRKTSDSLQAKIDAIDAEKRQIDQEINRLTSAPAARSDLRQLVGDWVARSAAEFAPAIAERVGRRYGAGQLPAYDAGLITAVTGSSGAVTAGDVDRALCALFPGEMKRTLCAVVDAMPWEAEGLPQAERATKIAQLQDRSARLSTQKTELLQSARDAGLDV